MTDTPFERDLNSTQSFGAIDLTAMPTNAVIGLSVQDQAAIAALPVGTALLIVLQAGGGSRFLLDTDKVTVGRHPRADIFSTTLRFRVSTLSLLPYLKAATRW